MLWSLQCYYEVFLIVQTQTVLVPKLSEDLLNSGHRSHDGALEGHFLVQPFRVSIQERWPSACSVVVTKLAFQARRPRFNPWSDLVRLSCLLR